MADDGYLPEGFATINAHLTIRGAAEAIGYYKKVFGAQETMRLVDPAGRIGHAELRIGDSLISVTDEIPEFGNKSPQTLGGSPIVLSVFVDDVDTLAERMIAAGGKVIYPIEDQFYGDRMGRIEDPFGHQWIIATHIEDVSHREMQRRFTEMMEGAGTER